MKFFTLFQKIIGVITAIGIGWFLYTAYFAPQPSPYIGIFEKPTEEGTELYRWSVGDDTPQLITFIEKNSRYSLSPTGSKLLVYFTDTIKLIDLSTTKEVILATKVVWPTIFIENIEHEFISWSPDGLKIAVLTGGPSWDDYTLPATTLSIFDTTSNSSPFVFNNNTWITEVSWSADSQYVAFPELPSPCFFTNSCHSDAVSSGWQLTTLAHKGGQRWALFQSQFISPLTKQYWSQSGLCQLSWSTNSQFITYQNNCALGQPPSAATLSIWPTHPDGATPQTITIFNPADVNYQQGYWLEKYNLLWVVFRRHTIAGSNSAGSDNGFEIYKTEGSTFQIVLQRTLKDIQFSIPFTLSISPYHQFALAQIENNQSLLIDFNNLAALHKLPHISLNGLWLPQGYLTQSAGEIILIDLETAERQIIHSAPSELQLVGWILKQ